MSQTERIKSMEALFDKAESAVNSLREALINYEEIEKDMEVLKDYYENGLWQKDFCDDEEGLIPKNLKRGVLSEDGLWNAFTTDDGNISVMKEILERHKKEEG